MTDIVKFIVEFRKLSYKKNSPENELKKSRIFSEIVKILAPKIGNIIKNINYQNDYNKTKTFIIETLAFIILEKNKENEFYLSIESEFPVAYILKVLSDRTNRAAYRIWLDDTSIVRQLNQEQNQFRYILRDFYKTYGHQPDFSNLQELLIVAKMMKTTTEEIQQIVATYNSSDMSINAKLSDDDDSTTLIDVLSDDKPSPEEEFIQNDRLHTIMNEAKKILTDMEYRIFSLYYFSEFIEGYMVDKWDIVDILGWYSTTGIKNPTSKQKREEGKSRSKVKNTLDRAKEKMATSNLLKEIWEIK